MKDTSFSVVLHNPKALPEQARAAVTRQLLPAIDSMFSRGVDRVRVTAEEDEDAITEEQRGYLHRVVLTECSMYCSANGEKYPMPIWKEYFRGRLLPDKVRTFINPITGRKSRRRVRQSTEDLGVRGMANYIDQVIAIIADELGHAVSQPLPPHLRGLSRTKPRAGHVDPETGEIMETAA